MHALRTFVVLLILACPLAINAQGTKADYERSAGLQKRFADKVYRDRVEPHWLKGSNSFWYRIQTGESTWEWILVDADKPERRPAFDHEQLASVLKKESIEASATSLPISDVSLSSDQKTLSFHAGDRNWTWTIGSPELKTIESLPSDDSVTSDRPRRRGRPNGETAITFINRTDKPVELFWLPNEDGERTSYGVLAPGQERRQHTFAGHRWLVADADGNELGTTRGRESPRTVAIPDDLRKSNDEARPPRRDAGAASPDGRMSVAIQDHNIVVTNRDSGEELFRSTDGSPADEYRDGLFWSPDSRFIAALRAQPAQEHTIYMVESSPRDQVQPKLHSLDYLKPGDRIAVSKPHLFDIAERKEIPVNDTLFATPWSIDSIQWAADSSRFTFLYNQRGHQALRVLSVEAATGAVKPIVNEESKTFIDYSGKMFQQHLPATNELIWMSEHSGWNHLYLYDSLTGEVKNAITSGEWVVRGVDRVDEQARQVWFHAGGVRPGQDPYFLHHCRVNFDGSDLVILTEGDGDHSIEFSPDRAYLIDTWSRVDQPPVTELRRASDGSLVLELERADWKALLETGWQAPEPFVAKGRDGTTDIYGVIWKPTNYNPFHTYPVIENIYAGPQGSFVPKSFREFYGQQAIAELGFIVVQIDGMGTSNRSKAFHDVCWKNLGDSGFPDRIAWLKAAADRFPSFDLTRVGIYGGSAGGQNSTRAMLAHGDFYKAAVSDCGCHDNRMDKIWWNEQWMGWPIGEHYAEQSNVTQAHKLTGKLMLVVGELDKNVDPASTMQVANALIKADKDFDLLIIPGAGHGACESPYGQRRRQDFFVRHLMGVEPRAN